MSTSSEAAGLRFIEMPATASQAGLSGAVWYPCAATPQQLRLSDILTVPAAKDCPVKGSDLPLIVMSHGRGGSFSGNHDTARTLAEAGFVVAAINHPGDTSGDTSRTDDLSIVIQRPSDMKRLIDYMLGAWPDRAKLDVGRIGFFGFSRGATTGLMVVGGRPDFRKRIDNCVEVLTTRMCEQVGRNEIPDESPGHDPRIRAAVLADPPFSVLFPAQMLRGVTAAIQLWSSAHGGDGVSLAAVTALGRDFQNKPDFHVVPNAGHFAFLAPCSSAQTKVAPRFCVDASDFDRTTFHEAFNAAVLGFFRQHLGERSK